MKSAIRKSIFSIGHSNRSLDELVRILKGREIGALVDVRSYPRSKRNSNFNREHLEVMLPGFGIEYRWIKELGGMRQDGYEEYMESEEFAEGLAKLFKTAESKLCCFMCAELKWRECHRSFVAEILFRDGWDVVHIYNETKVEKHAGMIGI
jgi:uncharacterized protein (DUF488 family)